MNLAALNMDTEVNTQQVDCANDNSGVQAAVALLDAWVKATTPRTNGHIAVKELLENLRKPMDGSEFSVLDILAGNNIGEKEERINAGTAVLNQWLKQHGDNHPGANQVKMAISAAKTPKMNTQFSREMHSAVWAIESGRTPMSNNSANQSSTRKKRVEALREIRRGIEKHFVVSL